TTNWNIPNAGNWSVDGNWTNNAPTAATTQANLTNGGTAQINSAATVGGTLAIGGNSTVELQTGGRLRPTNTTIKPTATLLLSGSTAVTGSINVAAGGTLRAATSGTLVNTITHQGTIAATSG